MQRYPDIHSLIDYCTRSAAPVGRFVLSACGEREADIEAADALCHSLQILNHIQDIGHDKRRLGRIYLPQDWMSEAGMGEEMLDSQRCSPALRQVIDRLLDRCDAMISQAAALPPTLMSRRLRLEVAAIRQVARALSKRLRVQDPLARRVRLPRWRYALCFLRAVPEAI